MGWSRRRGGLTSLGAGRRAPRLRRPPPGGPGFAGGSVWRHTSRRVDAGPRSVDRFGPTRAGLAPHFAPSGCRAAKCGPFRAAGSAASIPARRLGAPATGQISGGAGAPARGRPTGAAAPWRLESTPLWSANEGLLEGRCFDAPAVVLEALSTGPRWAQTLEVGPVGEPAHCLAAERRTVEAVDGGETLHRRPAQPGGAAPPGRIAEGQGPGHGPVGRDCRAGRRPRPRTRTTMVVMTPPRPDPVGRQQDAPGERVDGGAADQGVAIEVPVDGGQPVAGRPAATSNTGTSSKCSAKPPGPAAASAARRCAAWARPPARRPDPSAGAHGTSPAAPMARYSYQARRYRSRSRRRTSRSLTSDDPPRLPVAAARGVAGGVEYVMHDLVRHRAGGEVPHRPRRLQRPIQVHAVTLGGLTSPFSGTGRPTERLRARPVGRPPCRRRSPRPRPEAAGHARSRGRGPAGPMAVTTRHQGRPPAGRGVGQDRPRRPGPRRENRLRLPRRHRRRPHPGAEPRHDRFDPGPEVVRHRCGPGVVRQSPTISRPSWRSSRRSTGIDRPMTVPGVAVDAVDPGRPEPLEGEGAGDARAARRWRCRRRSLVGGIAEADQGGVGRRRLGCSLGSRSGSGRCGVVRCRWRIRRQRAPASLAVPGLPSALPVELQQRIAPDDEGGLAGRACWPLPRRPCGGPGPAPPPPGAGASVPSSSTPLTITSGSRPARGSTRSRAAEAEARMSRWVTARQVGR